VTRADGSVTSQITAFTNGVDHFPHGALWSPRGTALVGAGTVFGTNGLWIIPLSPNSLQCDCPPLLIPTSPGDPIDFAGSIVVAAPPSPPVSLFIRLDANDVVVYWPTNAAAYNLESTTNLAPPASWKPVAAFIPIQGFNFEYTIPPESFKKQQFFRLRQP
jgi:hypothetical protein